MSHDAKNADPADRAAIEWLVRLGEAEDATVFEAFEAWVTASPEHAQAWAEVGATTRLIEAAAPQLSTARLFAGERRRRSGRGLTVHRASRRGVIAATVAAAAAVVVAVLAVPEVAVRVRSDHVTAVAELRTIALPDGSAVTLGPRSAVAVDYDGRDREVRLVRGEAYFEVARNPNRPFRVLSSQVETTVLGTGFEVQDGEGRGRVGVRHGRVAVKAAAGSGATVLTAGEGVRVDASGSLEPYVTHPDNIAAWTGKRLIVEARPVTEAIDAIRPWYGGAILARGSRLDAARVTGVYDLSDPVGSLVALSRANGASVQRISPWLVVISFD